MKPSLAAVKQVEVYYQDGSEKVNQLLESGRWTLLDVRVIQRELWRSGQMGVEPGHIYKEPEVVYVVGRVR
jgi:hypothetical protein